MRAIVSTIVLAIMAGFISPVIAQKILNLPSKYYFPIDYETNTGKREQQVIDGGAPKNKKSEYWLVISDRENNPVYTSPSGSEVAFTMRFKEHGYVIENRDEWVKIGIGRKDDNKFVDLKKSGWIQKKKLLLWPHSLVDENNSIAKKAFLLNKVSDMNKLEKEPNFKLVRVFNGPESEEVVQERSIYNVYFIYKREGSRLLLGGSNALHQRNIDEYLLGWVDEYRVVKWNQRLALECNYDVNDYKERLDSKNYVRGFYTDQAATDFASSGTLQSENILWDNDPVKMDISLRATENERRPKGEIFRFPIFSMLDKSIETGALLRIPLKGSAKNFDPKDQLKLEEKIKNMQSKLRRLNIYFLVEGTSVMSAYRSSIASVISSVDTFLTDGLDVRYGAAIYRDAGLKESGQDFVLKKLTSNKNSVLEFISNERFIDAHNDFDSWTNFRYAINQLLIKGEIPENELNMIVVLGANADFSFNKARALASDASDLITDEKMEMLEEKLEKFKVNLSFFQLERKSGRSYSYFADDARGLLVSIATKQEAEQRRYLDNLKIPDLSIDDLQENDKKIESNGVFYGYFLRPEKETALTLQELATGVGTSIQSMVTRYEKATKFYFDLVMGGESLLKVGEDYAPIIYDILSGMVEQGYLSQNDVEMLKSERIKLYSKMFLPRKINGLDDPYKTVVFMPSSELDDYTSRLGELERALNGPSDVQREQLYQVLVELMQKLSGDKLSKDEINKSSIDVLRKKLIGLEMEGFSIQNSLGFKIEDVKNKKIVSEEELQKITTRVVQCRRELKKIRDKGSKYDFSYSILDANEQSLYYWLATDLLF